MRDEASLQQRYAPENRCFGCGAANPRGLHLQSFPAADDPDRLVAEWMPEEHHQAFGGVLNGGIIGALLDCHSNWTATWYLMRRDGLEAPPCTVTADFHVKLKRPTPMDEPVVLAARPKSSETSRVEVEATLSSHGKVTATCRGAFIAVKRDHPAYHRW